MNNAPRNREKNITGKGKSVYRRGEGLGIGKVGSNDGYEGRGETPDNNSGKRSSGSSKSPITIIIAIIILLFGGGTGISSILGNSTSSSINSTISEVSTSSGWTRSSNTGKLNESVDSAARDKYTTCVGNGNDTITIMIYMCGADLESKSGMATSDLQEMLNATLSDKVNLLVYTGGSTAWKNNIVSSKTNQIYKIENGNIKCLENNFGNVSMTTPSTLTSFINYCTKNYPAERQDLILWDHGGGSISGYGYDEKFSSSGSMSLKGINEALSKAKTKFDFIGFDACLMATVENGLMLSNYADYMIASEETEPGVGWYYTNWLTKLSSNTSMPTIEIGKNIADDFVSVCGQKCSGQKTTLSVTDLAELSATVPSELSEFSTATLEQLQNNEYKTIASARSTAREFAESSKIDQVDLVSLATNIDTKTSKKLADTLIDAVKYNQTSSNMTDAYGLSIYFPYQKVSKVNNAVATYDAIGMDSDYSKCIQKYASLEVSGQAVSGGATSPISMLINSNSAYSSNNSSSSSYTSADMITSLLTQLMTGGTGNVSGLTSTNSSFLGKSIDLDNDVQYLLDNRFNTEQLVWTTDSDGNQIMSISEDQWELVSNLELNVFLDDGSGYIDLGLDNVFEITKDNKLKGEYDGTWLAINNQPVAYYHTDTVEDGDNYTITGYIPAKLNNVRVKLIVVFDNENPNGYIAGVETVYSEDSTDTLGKSMIDINDGDVIDFLCDYYSYSGEYLDSYYLGDQLTVSGELNISNVELDTNNVSPAYKFTDIYQQSYWTPVIK